MIKIAILYPSVLNVYGCMGNMLQIEKKLGAYGVPFEIKTIDLNDKVNLGHIDMLFIGSPCHMHLKAVIKMLEVHKDAIQDFLNQGGILYASGLSSVIFGKKIVTDNEAIEGLNIYNYSSHMPLKSEIEINKVRSTYDGFIRYIIITNIKGIRQKHNYDILGVYSKRGETFKEGIVIDNTILTTSVGVTLIRNPELCAAIIGKILEQRGIKVPNKFFGIDEMSKKIRSELFRLVTSAKE